MRTVAVIALAACAACADLPDIDPDGCGNLVVNADEDCDGFGDGDGTACGAPDDDNACFFVCGAASGAVCPAGWGCGQDGRCRAASGQFEQAPGSPWRFPVRDFDIGDVDGDGHQDLVGDAVASLTIRFASADGGLATDLDVFTPRAQGPVTVGRFDEDELVDAIVPISGGLFVALGSEQREMLPVAYTPFSLGDVGTNGLNAVALEAIPANLNTELVVMIGSFMTFMGSTAPGSAMPGSFDVNDLAGRVPVADLDRDGSRLEMALGFAGDDRVHLYTSTGGPLQGESNNLAVAPYGPGSISLPPGHVVQFGSMLADVDGANGPDLMISVREQLTSRSRIAVALNDGSGTLGSALIRPVFDRADDSSPWPLLAADFNGDGKADYVYPELVAIADFGVDITGVPTTLTPTALAAGQLWGEAAAADFNGDDIADIAAVSESVDGVDFLLGVTDGNGNPFGFFNPFHLDTNEPPRSLRVGDYDGDFVHDVAFVEAGFGLQPDSVSVIFGDTAGGPSAPVSMGALGFVDGVEPISMVVSADTLDAITDLFVLSSSFPDRDSKAVAVLFGSSSRRMLSPFTLSPPVTPEDTDPDPDLARRALIGEFNDAAQGFNDVIAMSEAVAGTDANSTGVGVKHLWRVNGSDGKGGLDAATAGFIDMPDDATFLSACSVWTAGDIDDDGLAEAVGIDNALGQDFTCFGLGGSPPGRMLVGTSDPTSAEDPVSADIVELPGALRAARDVALRDLDGDGDLDLLIAFAGELRGGGGASGVAVLWNGGGALDPASMTVVDTGAAVFDADVITLDDGGVPGLIILVEGRVLISRLDLETKQYGPPEDLGLQKGDGRMEVGDVDGDGVEDFAFTVGTDVTVMLGVPAAPRGSSSVTIEGGAQ